MDGANAAQDFLKRHGSRRQILTRMDGDRVAHDTGHSEPYASGHRAATAGVEMDVLGLAYDEYSTPSARRW